MFRETDENSHCIHCGSYAAGGFCITCAERKKEQERKFKENQERERQYKEQKRQERLRKEWEREEAKKQAAEARKQQKALKKAQAQQLRQQAKENKKAQNKLQKQRATQPAKAKTKHTEKANQFSFKFALIGALVSGLFVYFNGTAVGQGGVAMIAAVIGGLIAGSLYKVIIGVSIIALVLWILSIMK